MYRERHRESRGQGQPGRQRVESSQEPSPDRGGGSRRQLRYTGGRLHHTPYLHHATHRSQVTPYTVHHTPCDTQEAGYTIHHIYTMRYTGGRFHHIPYTIHHAIHRRQVTPYTILTPCDTHEAGYTIYHTPYLHHPPFFVSLFFPFFCLFYTISPFLLCSLFFFPFLSSACFIFTPFVS